MVSNRLTGTERYNEHRKNIQIVKDFFTAIGGYDEHDLLALVSDDIEWIIPGTDWPLERIRI
ncbi:hypothetical protein E0J21_34635 [Rhizobium laguerreae]|nr:hypothetical protein E0J21_34635 [Rhizobium laguerreae]